MQKCEVCNTRFTWKQFFVSLMLAYRPVACRSCGTIHKVTSKTRVFAALMLFVPVVVANLYLMGSGIEVFFLALLIIFAVESLILPFLMKYTVEPASED